jgi:hypothetical protein
MKSILKTVVILGLAFQILILYGYCSTELSTFTSYAKIQWPTVMVIWISCSLLGFLSGAIYFFANRQHEFPFPTLILVAGGGLMLFQMLLFKSWSGAAICVIAVVSFHLYTYKSNRFILLPIVSFVMGLYSIGLVLIANWIGSM